MFELLELLSPQTGPARAAMQPCLMTSDYGILLSTPETLGSVCAEVSVPREVFFHQRSQQWVLPGAGS